jgi:hypothetical protein
MFVQSIARRAECDPSTRFIALGGYNVAMRQLALACNKDPIDADHYQQRQDLMPKQEKNRS